MFHRHPSVDVQAAGSVGVVTSNHGLLNGIALEVFRHAPSPAASLSLAFMRNKGLGATYMKR